jgi:hypothetical protein
MFSGSSVSVSHASFRVFRRENVMEGAPAATLLKPAILAAGAPLPTGDDLQPAAVAADTSAAPSLALQSSLLPDVPLDSEEDLTCWLSDQIPVDATFVDA